MAKVNKVYGIKKRTSNIQFSRLNISLYSLLLIATPFLMLQNFLQSSIHELSNFKVPVTVFDIPFILGVFAALLIFLAFRYRKYLNKVILLVSLVVLVLMAIGQNTADYYIDYRYYDLQNNWHYIAYAIFVFIAYREFTRHCLPLNKIVSHTVMLGFLISTFDEGVQVFLTSRVFDISDIAKDVWGIMMGLVILCFVVRKQEIMTASRCVSQPNIVDYYKNPLSLLVLMLILSYIFLFTSSLLTSYEYWYYIIVITVLLFSVAFFLIHVSQYPILRKAVMAVFAVAVLLQAYLFIKYSDDIITYNQPNITVYKGIPLVFFDIMIYPDGCFRPVDKKIQFKGGDIKTLLKQDADILLIGSGSKGDGGKGIGGTHYTENRQFLYSDHLDRGVQVAIFDTPEACRLYNRLVSEGYKVLFIIHNS